MTTINVRRFPSMPSPVTVPDATVLGDGELGFEDATGTIKIGDGKTMWRNLPSPNQPVAINDAAPPTTLAWRAGSIVWNTAPEAGGNIGWVCIAGGTPGTWAPFGAISA